MAKQQIPNFKQLLMLGYLTGNLNQYLMCQQTACTLTLKETPHVSCIRSPPGLEVIITNFAVTQMLQCDCLVDAQGISQGLRKNGVSNAFEIHFLGPEEGFEVIPYLHTIKFNSCSSNNNLKLRGPRACTKDCVKTLQITSPLYRLVASEYQENWIHAHRDPKEGNELPTTIDLSIYLFLNLSVTKC